MNVKIIIYSTLPSLQQIIHL